MALRNDRRSSLPDRTVDWVPEEKEKNTCKLGNTNPATKVIKDTVNLPTRREEYR